MTRTMTRMSPNDIQFVSLCVAARGLTSCHAACGPSTVNPGRSIGYLDAGLELMRKRFDDGGPEAGMPPVAAVLPQSDAVVGHR